MNLFQTPDPNVEIIRSFSYKHGLPSYSAVDGFMSLKTTVPLSSAEEAAGQLHAACQRIVMAEIIAYSAAVGAPPPKYPAPLPAPEKSPFKVSPAPTPSSGATVTPQPVGGDSTGTSSRPGAGNAAPVPPSALPVAGVTQAPPPSEAPRRRGRAKGGEMAGAGNAAPDSTGIVTQPIPETPKGPQLVPPVESPKAPYVPTDEDVPSNIGVPERITQVERFNRIVDRLTGCPRDTVPWKKGDPLSAWMANKQKCQQFMRAFSGMEQLPRDIQTSLSGDPNAIYARVLPVLEAFASMYAGHLRADAATAGLGSGNGYNKLVRHVDKWRPDLNRLAIEVGVSVYPDNPIDLIEFVEDVPIEGDANLLTFLHLVRRSKEIAGRVRAYGGQMFDLMEGLDVESCPEGEILGRLVAR